MNIKSLSRKLKKLEQNKTKEEIPIWCIKEAERRAFMDSFCYRNLLLLSKHIGRVEAIRPKPWSDIDIKQFALELSEKYSSYQEYEEKRRSMDLKKLRNTIAREKAREKRVN
jgi:hypothetical protein